MLIAWLSGSIYAVPKSARASSLVWRIVEQEQAIRIAESVPDGIRLLGLCPGQPDDSSRDRREDAGDFSHCLG